MYLRKIAALFAFLAASLTWSLYAADATLVLGDAAPKIEVQDFVKGTPVKKFEAGKIYVVEFWATWCGPCLQSIPHLTELQKKNPEVIFVGVSLDEDISDVKTFVKEMGDKMGYRVAVDSRTKEVAEGLMFKSWLAASLQDGIPASFVVNKEGKLAWIGHPGELEEPLQQIVEGKWDLDAEVKRYAELIAAKRAAADLEGAFTAAVEAKKYKQALEILDNVLSKNPALEADWALSKLWTLILTQQTEQAVTYGQHIVDEIYQDDPTHLLLVAGLIVRPEEYAPFGNESDAEKTAESETETPSKKTADEVPVDKQKNIPEKAKPQTEDQGEGSKIEKTEINAEKTSKVDPKLVQLAVQAAERAAELSADSTDITERTTVVEILAAAYALDGQKQKATEVLASELEILNEQLAVTKAAVLMIKSQLNDLKDKPSGEPDQPKTTEDKGDEKGDGEPSEKKTEDDSSK